jgi:transcriptional regulator with XRE-family HTH domain
MTEKHSTPAKRPPLKSGLSTTSSASLIQLGERMSLARKRRGLTQADLAERMHTTPRTLYRLERGDPTVSLGVLARVLDALELERELNGILAEDSVGTWAAQRSTPRRVRGKNKPRTP